MGREILNGFLKTQAVLALVGEVLGLIPFEPDARRTHIVGIKAGGFTSVTATI